MRGYVPLSTPIKGVNDILITINNIIDKLSQQSQTFIRIECDYCHKEFNRRYIDFLNNRTNSVKDYCRYCIKIKNTEKFLLDVGSSQVDEIVKYSLKYENKLSGVYSIRNKRNNKAYIGSSTDVINRWRDHILRKNTKSHYCKEFNELDSGDLEFLLLYLNEDDNPLTDVEYRFIDLYNTDNPDYGYNTMTMSSGKSKSQKSTRAPITYESKEKRYKLKSEDVELIKLKLIEGVRIIDIAKKYNVSQSTISDIKRCKTWIEVNSELNNKLLSLPKSFSLDGQDNHTSKLTNNEATEIKKLIRDTSLTNVKIAEMYNVNCSTISKIRTGKAWTHITI